jgi:hypothetical protein
MPPPSNSQYNSQYNPQYNSRIYQKSSMSQFCTSWVGLIFRLLDPGVDEDENGWSFPPGFYLAKKQEIDGDFYLHYLAKYKINGKVHRFNGWSSSRGRLELIEGSPPSDGPPVYAVRDKVNQASK